MTHHDSACTTQGRSTKSYILGFILAVIFTYAAYAMVVNHVFTGESLYVALAILMIVQLVVQVICFIQLNAKTEDARWNLISFIFTLLIIAIVVTGSLWIMYNLNYNMVN